MERQSIRFGPGLFGCLGILFLTLKLCGVIDWAWWLVLLPFYGPITLVIAFLFLCITASGIMLTLAALLDLWDAQKKG